METHKIEIGGPDGGVATIQTPDGFGKLFVDAQMASYPPLVEDSTTGEQISNTMPAGQHAALSVLAYVRSVVATENERTKTLAAKVQAQAENDGLAASLSVAWSPK